MNVLVTGGAGYLGAVMVPVLLDAGHSVTVVDNLMYRQQSLLHVCGREGFTFVRGDVRDAALMRRLVAAADAIVPLAAVVGAPACDRDPDLARSVNVGAVALLLRLRDRAQPIVYPTTNSGYGARTGADVCTEDTPLEPVSLYGETKAEAERAVLDAGHSLTLRLATVFGVSPRMRTDLLVNHFVYAAVTDGHLVIFEKHFKRNFVHIRDVAECTSQCLARVAEMSGRCYNLGLDSANMSKAELALTIREHVPGFDIRFDEIGRDPDKRNYTVSSERLRGFGIAPRRTLDEGIRELIQAYAMLGSRRDSNA